MSQADGTVLASGWPEFGWCSKLKRLFYEWHLEDFRSICAEYPFDGKTLPDIGRQLARLRGIIPVVWLRSKYSEH